MTLPDTDLERGEIPVSNGYREPGPEPDLPRPGNLSAAGGSGFRVIHHGTLLITFYDIVDEADNTVREEKLEQTVRSLNPQVWAAHAFQAQQAKDALTQQVTHATVRAEDNPA
jgi:hypothetical protein